MDKTFILPKSINGSLEELGLEVNYLKYEDFEMTNFNIKFPKDGPKAIAEKKSVSGRYFSKLSKIFKEILLKKGYKEEEIFIVNIFRTGIIINITKHFNKEEALRLISDICNEILLLSKNDLEFYEHIHDKIKIYLGLITTQNQYKYSDIIFKFSDLKYKDLKI